MENNLSKNNTNLNYNFIAVPTQLFILLDYRLKVILTSLIQVSSALGNSNGWFFYSLDDFKKLCGLKSDKTVRACMETLYRLNLLEVKSRSFKSNIGKRVANYYRVNFNEIEKYNEYSVYECLNIEELHIEMLDYTSRDYQTTYTAITDTNESFEEIPTEVKAEPSKKSPKANKKATSTEPSKKACIEEPSKEIPTESAGNSPRSVEVSVGEETPMQSGESASKAQEKPISEVIEKVSKGKERLTEAEFEQLRKDCRDEYNKELDELFAEKEIVSSEIDEETSIEMALDDIYNEHEVESPSKSLEKIELDGKVVETASVFSGFGNVEYRSKATPIDKKYDNSIKEKCIQLVERYKEMIIPTSNQSVEKCNQACMYVIDKYNKGYIDYDTKERILNELITARFNKFSV